MACERPLTIKNPRYDDSNIDEWRDFYWRRYRRKGIPDGIIEVPCGECYSCLRSRLNGWRIRLLAEFERYPTAIFVTFTFDDYWLDHFKDNPNRAVRLWLDRSRKAYNFHFRHFIIAEYGDSDEYVDKFGKIRKATNRLHYHGLLFGQSFLDYEKFAKLWKYGHIFLCRVPNAKYPDVRQAANYVVKYLTKDPHDDRKLPRIIASKGIGANYVEKYGEQHRRDIKPYIVYKGKYRIPLPSYLRDKIFDELDRLDMAEMRRLSPFCRVVDGIKYFDEESYRVALDKFARKQISLGLSAPKKFKPHTRKRKLTKLEEYINSQYSKFEDYGKELSTSEKL